MLGRLGPTKRDWGGLACRGRSCCAQPMARAASFHRRRLAIDGVCSTTPRRSKASCQHCEAVRCACNCTSSRVFRRATPLRAPAASSTTPTLHAPDGRCKPPLTLRSGSTGPLRPAWPSWCKQRARIMSWACCLSRLTDGPEAAAPSHEHLASSIIASWPRASSVGNASSPVAATRAASSAANSAAVHRQICTRGMEPGLSAATLQIRRDRHQASSPRILAQSWNHGNAHNRSIGVSSLKPPLLGDFLSRFAQSAFGCSVQSIALANTSSYWATSARWHTSRDGAAALPRTQHKVLEPETFVALYHSGQAL
jgi:hypothetical protein